jgi:hypothetical protein
MDVLALTVAAFLAASALHWGGDLDFHPSREYAALLGFSAILAAAAARRTHWLAGLALFWTLLCSLRIWEAPASPYVGVFDPQSVQSLSLISASSFAFIVAMVVPFLLDRELAKRVWIAARWLCWLDSLYVVGQWVAGVEPFYRGGFFGNGAMNAAVIAFTFPALEQFVRSRRRVWVLWPRIIARAVPCLAVLAAHSNIALAALIVGIVAVEARRGAVVHRWAAVLSSAAALGLVGWHLMGGKFGENSGRFALWRAAMHWWWERHNHWIGAGTGTFLGFGQVISKDLHAGSNWLWLHNDWLQVLFEQGAIGAALVAALFVLACSRAPRWVFAALAAYAVTACGHYPARLPVPAFFGLALVVLAIGSDRARAREDGA